MAQESCCIEAIVTGVASFSLSTTEKDTSKPFEAEAKYLSGYKVIRTLKYFSINHNGMARTQTSLYHIPLMAPDLTRQCSKLETEFVCLELRVWQCMAIPTTRVRRRQTTESRRRRLGRSAACNGFVIPNGEE